jgi:hypothetical protein
VGTDSIGAVLHPEIKAAQKTALAVSVAFIKLPVANMAGG